MINEKRCYKCKTMKPLDSFYRHSGRPDGRQTFCKACDRNAFGKNMQCSICGDTFRVNHRNIATRKTTLCSPCSLSEFAKSTAARNRANARPEILSTKGYRYVRDLTKAHGYILDHRKVMERHLDRELETKEIVHHIDGDRENNAVENLWLTDHSGHRKAHRSIEVICFHLYDLGVIAFDPEIGQYKLDEEKLNIPR